jgi:hypothetical protein
MLQKGAGDTGLECCKRISIAMLGEPFLAVNRAEPNVPAGESLAGFRASALQALKAFMKAIREVSHRCPLD